MNPIFSLTIFLDQNNPSVVLDGFHCYEIRCPVTPLLSSKRKFVFTAHGLHGNNKEHQ